MVREETPVIPLFTRAPEGAYCLQYPNLQSHLPQEDKL